MRCITTNCLVRDGICLYLEPRLCPARIELHVWWLYHGYSGGQYTKTGKVEEEKTQARFDGSGGTPSALLRGTQQERFAGSPFIVTNVVSLRTPSINRCIVDSNKEWRYQLGTPCRASEGFHSTCTTLAKITGCRRHMSGSALQFSAQQWARVVVLVPTVVLIQWWCNRRCLGQKLTKPAVTAMTEVAPTVIPGGRGVESHHHHLHQ